MSTAHGRKRPYANSEAGMNMTPSTSNRYNNTDETNFETGHSFGASAASALFYPSLAGHGWDDELLPSGD